MHNRKPLLDWRVGSIVKKKSKKPFPHGEKTATITGECTNPYSGKKAYTLKETVYPIDCKVVELCKI